ncbi:MAG: exonuclease SbcCD subunit D, partial [Alphaproteobacteria bacterium]
LSEEERTASRLALERLVDVAVREQVDLVVFAGDVFDTSHVDQATAAFWLGQLERLCAQAPVVMVAGNHDAGNALFRDATLPPGATRLASHAPERRVFHHLDIEVFGQGLSSTTPGGPDLAAGFPAAESALFTIGLLHTSLDGREGYRVFAPTRVEALRERRYDYWALGHVHQREEVGRGDPWIVYPGSLQGRGILETGPKGATLVTVEGREVAGVRALELDPIRWTRFRVDLGGGLAGLDDVPGRIEAALAHAVAEARGAGDFSDRLVLAHVELACPDDLREECSRRNAEFTREARAIADRWGGLRVERVVVDRCKRVDRDPLAQPR